MIVIVVPLYLRRIVRSEPLGPQQRVGEVKQQAQGDEAGERVIENHGLNSSKPFAGVAVTHRQREQREAESQHDDVKHWDAPVAAGFAGRLALLATLSGAELPPAA
jgi:hypothetical protein